MIDILKQKVETKIEIKIKNRGDCELLSNAIFHALGVNISYNTIRRLYGLGPAVKTSLNTLNVIAEFCDYNSYAHFTQTYLHEKENNLSQLVSGAIYRCDEAEIIELIQETKRSSNDFISFIITLTRELLYNQHYYHLDIIFRLKELKYENFSYSEVLTIGNSIGLLVRRNQFMDKLLLRNANFLRCIYLTFVDYSSLNSYYGEWTKIIDKETKTEEIKLFSKAILEFRNFLNNRSINDSFENQAFSAKLNPILCSRLISIKILTQKHDKTEAILDKYYQVHSERKSLLLDYSHELFLIAIFSKNTVLMNYLIKIMNESQFFYYHKHHLNSFYLMCLFYYKLSDNKTKQKKYLQLFNLNYTRYSYFDLIKLLHNVYLYAFTETISDKNVIQADYNQICEKIEYPYFSEVYLKNYFIKSEPELYN
jgi:predicted CopG family antitoxin